MWTDHVPFFCYVTPCISKSICGKEIGMVLVNGEAKTVAGMNLKEFLAQEGYDLEKVVVERNLDIIPRTELDQVTIEEEDTIEVLRFVGGG